MVEIVGVPSGEIAPLRKAVKTDIDVAGSHPVIVKATRLTESSKKKF
jgi:hypothetical protein